MFVHRLADQHTPARQRLSALVLGQAMYVHNFAYFDPQIWFNEEEMRKQVEQLNGRFVLTGLQLIAALSS